MKAKSFIILAVVCGVLALGAWLMLNPGAISTAGKDRTGEKLLADLPVNDVAAIILGDSEKTVHLKKGESVWEVTDRFGYPADFKNIAEFAKKLVDMKIGRAFAADDDTRKRLALFKPDQADIDKESKGTHVLMTDKGGKVLLDMVIGKAREAASGSGGHYVMSSGDKSVYLVDAEFSSLNVNPEKWLDRKLLDIKGEDVQKIVCFNPFLDKTLYMLERPAKGEKPVFVNPPEGKKIKAMTLNDTFGALTNLNLEDIADPNTPTETTGFRHALCYTVSLFDGTIYTICPGRPTEADKNRHYCRISVAYNAPPEAAASEEKSAEKAPETDSAVKPEGEAKPDSPASDAPEPAAEKTATDSATKPEGETKSDAPATDMPKPADEKPAAEKIDTAKLAAEARKLNDEFSKWIYIVPKWKVSHLVDNVDDFFETPEPPKPAEGAVPGAGVNKPLME